MEDPSILLGQPILQPAGEIAAWENQQEINDRKRGDHLEADRRSKRTIVPGNRQHRCEGAHLSDLDDPVHQRRQQSSEHPREDDLAEGERVGHTDRLRALPQ